MTDEDKQMLAAIEAGGGLNKIAVQIAQRQMLAVERMAVALEEIALTAKNPLQFARPSTLPGNVWRSPEPSDSPLKSGGDTRTLPGGRAF